MEAIVTLQRNFLKHHYYPHLIIVVVLCVVSEGFVSFKSLEFQQAAKVMEIYAALAGIALFVPLFLPEQDKEIWLLTRSKKRDMWKQYLQRGITALFALTLVVSFFSARLLYHNPQMDAGTLWFGSICEILFLGSIGYFFSAVTNQVIIGYMLSIIFYVSNFGGGKVYGKFALFQMMQGTSGFEPYMLGGAVLLLISGVIIRELVSYKCN